MSMNTTTMTTKSAEEFLKEPYARVLIPETEGGFSAEILEFPGCYAMGETADEALSNLTNVAISWIEIALSQGKKIPEALAKYEGSGKVALRLPRSTHHKAVQMAERENVSLNTFIVGAVEAKVAVRDFYDHMVESLESRLIKQTAANVMARVIPVIQAWDEVAFPAEDRRAATPGSSGIVVNNFIGGK